MLNNDVWELIGRHQGVRLSAIVFMTHGVDARNAATVKIQNAWRRRCVRRLPGTRVKLYSRRGPDTMRCFAEGVVLHNMLEHDVVHVTSSISKQHYIFLKVPCDARYKCVVTA